MSEQAHLESIEINLPTSSPSDWRLVLQDSITKADIQQGCISLFDQVNSNQTLTQIEVNHAVRFLEYAIIHIEHRDTQSKKLTETIFPEEEKYQTKVTSALIKLICHPSDKLRAVALSFFDTSLRYSTQTFSAAVASTGLLPQLFINLKPHAIPINRTTIEFHRHLTSIVDDFFRFCTPEDISGHLNLNPYSSRDRQGTSELLDPIIQQFCAYLRYLLTHPVSPTEYHSGFSLLRKTKLFERYITRNCWPPSHPDLKQFIDDLKKTMTEELASLLDRDTEKETLHCFLFNEWRMTDKHRWAKTFEGLLVRLSEGRPITNVGFEAFLLFMSRRPSDVKPEFYKDGTFSIEIAGKNVSSKTLPLKALFSLFVPTQAHHTTALLAAFRGLMLRLGKGVLVERIWSGWSPAFFDAVNPSKLPFTNEFEPLHTKLVEVLNDRFDNIWDCAHDCHSCCSRMDMKEIHRSFYEQAREYIVHLSLHPFALATESRNNIIVIDFLICLFRNGRDDPLAKSYRDELRQQMDEAARSSSPPQFILTSELVCRLTDEELIDVVDRIVGLLESDSCLDDDTILRICKFHENQLSSIYLPALFRIADRTTEQYFHALESLISLHVDSFNLHPINYLLNSQPNRRLSKDEWDEIDLETVGDVMRAVRENRLSFKHISPRFTQHLLDFTAVLLPQINRCATRLTLSQLERLLSPSFHMLSKIFFELEISCREVRIDQEKIFLDVCQLCDQRPIARCLSSVGFFSRVVGGLFDDSISIKCRCIINVIVPDICDSCEERAEKTKIRRTLPLFQEEGWQDAVEFILVKKKVDDFRNQQFAWFGRMMQFHGANLGDLIDLDDTD
ncbi:hypothetical protein BLNAU_10406 [Blattamonas nauphoetae]|uniref:Uncharacterized protein n=1 Tax=Blattamonas nauphoetae TaxID=2049346 RepID=A0ABQ9XSG8_9EUKA|nr:hypothetical protein BLNAU_10406 [Blattamonas nauphoetae]